jgi:hypothetical protein
MAKLSPIGNVAQFINGIPANGAKLFTYAAGSSTKQTTYTDEAGLTPQSNPIILDSRGEPSQPIWLTEGLSYKFVFAPSTDSDPPVSPIWDVDDVTGINDASVSVDQWEDSGLTPTYVSATSFTVPGDQTSIFTNKRRLKTTVTAGTAYSTVLSAVFGALTTVTVVNDSTTLDSGLSSVQLGLLTPENTSIPSIVESFRATVAATATTTPLWVSTAQIQDWTGTPTITDFPDASRAGLWRVVYPAAGTIFTDNANIDVQGDANYTVVAGDKIYIESLTVSTFKVYIQKKSGAPVLLPTATTTVEGVVELLTTAEVQTGTDTTRAMTASAFRGGWSVLATSGALSSGTGTNVGSIPSWATEILIFFVSVSTNGTSQMAIQIGDAGGLENTGYIASATTSGGTNVSSTAMFPITGLQVAANTYSGVITLTNANGNIWAISGTIKETGTDREQFCAGVKELSAVLTQFTIRMINGTDAFDGAGTYAVRYR